MQKRSQKVVGKYGYGSGLDGMVGYSYDNHVSKYRLGVSSFFKGLRIWYMLFCLALFLAAYPYLHYSLPAAAGLIFIAFNLSAYRYLKPPQLKMPRFSAELMVCLDFVLIGVLIYLTGGMKSFFYPAFIMPILACTISFGMVAGFYGFGLSIILSGLIVISGNTFSSPAFFYIISGPGTLAFAIWVVGFLLKEEARLRKDLYTTSVTDHLTGLFHRGYVRERVSEEIRLCGRREGGRFAIVFLDLDRFKTVNDRWGHIAGDEVLKHIAAVLKETVRGGETLARYGGDEFLLLMPGATGKQAEQTLERLRRTAQFQPYFIDHRSVRVGISGGVAEYPREGTSIEQLLLAADKKMYYQKG